MVVESFISIAHRIVWCTLATVDRRGRPRSRLVHPIWPGGPDDPDAAVIRLDPWRLKAADAATLAAGGTPHVWRRA